jgi:hypothetical protein
VLFFHNDLVLVDMIGAALAPPQEYTPKDKNQHYPLTKISQVVSLQHETTQTIPKKISIPNE